LKDSFWSYIEQRIRDYDSSFTIEQRSPVSGGSISKAWRIEGCGHCYFVKTNANAAGHGDMFAAEAVGLAELADADALRVPRPVAHGDVEHVGYLICEWVDCSPAGTDCAERLGHQLVTLHKHTAQQYGLNRDNTIGATLQKNTQANDWCSFWREQRLGFQLALAAKNGFTGRLQSKGAQLMDHLEMLLAGHQPPASLLHGDLWGGNWAADEQGMPVVFDPAVYYGDREADLAMTELFGGFPAAFYEAYNEVWPLDDGYKLRKTLYNLYHILNHANLFGGGYVAQAEMMIDSLLAEVS